MPKILLIFLRFRLAWAFYCWILPFQSYSCQITCEVLEFLSITCPSLPRINRDLSTVQVITWLLIILVGKLFIRSHPCFLGLWYAYGVQISTKQVRLDLSTLRLEAKIYDQESNNILNFILFRFSSSLPYSLYLSLLTQLS